MDAVDWKGRLGMFGYPSHEVGSQLSWWAEHVHPDDRASAVARIEQALRSDATNWSSEYRFLAATTAKLG